MDITKNKVYRIIKDNFDLRTDAMVLTYLLDKGIEFCSNITEEDISEVEGNAIMTDDFVQSIVRTASIIAKETNLFDDIFPYISYRFEDAEEEDNYYE